jgi:hypothetical protein
LQQKIYWEIIIHGTSTKLKAISSAHVSHASGGIKIVHFNNPYKVTLFEVIGPKMESSSTTTNASVH